MCAAILKDQMGDEGPMWTPFEASQGNSPEMHLMVAPVFQISDSVKHVNSQMEVEMLEKPTLPQPRYLGASTFWGTIFLISGFISLLMFFYSAVLSKILPASENQYISAIQNDRYYCLLVPLTLPVLVMAVYLHWLSMKLFKHA